MTFASIEPDERGSSACKALIRTVRYCRPYTPRTTGKAEHLVQTSLREWAYARAYDNSGQRAGALHDWLHHYNWHQPHASLGYTPYLPRTAEQRAGFTRLAQHAPSA